MITIEPKDTILKAFHLLEEYSLLALPVYSNESKRFIGIVTIEDLLLVTLLGSAFMDFGLWNQEKDAQNQIEEWLSLHEKIFEKILIQDALAHHSPLRIFYSDENILALTDHFRRTGAHRSLVCERGKENDINWYTMVSQTDIIRHLHLNQERLDEHVSSLQATELMQVASETILTPFMEFDTRPFKGPVLVSKDTPTLIALRIMSLYSHSCVGVIEDDGKMVGNISWSDFRGFNMTCLEKILLKVTDYVTQVHHLELKERNVCIDPSTGFTDCLEKMLVNHVHRLWVCDEKNAPVGVITMSDLLEALFT